MPIARAVIQCKLKSSFRTKQILGMFDVPDKAKSRHEYAVEIPDLDGDWQVGAIVGPSGSGKTTIARHVFGRRLYTRRPWPRNKAIVDALPQRLTIKQITGTLTAVGFSSPPAWLRPYALLSNGEQFRCDLARALLTGGDVIAFDEFSSVVDRTVAQVGSAAVAKAIRKERVPTRRFVAVACHYDILEWLSADWVVDMATCQLARGCLQRPKIKLEIVRCHRSAWEVFAPHHYLTGELHPSALCYLATWNGRAVAFAATSPALGCIRRRRVTRLVVLPDFQGIGIGRATITAVADIHYRQGQIVSASFSHSALLAAFRDSPVWRCVEISKVGSAHTGSEASRGSFGRAVVRFFYDPRKAKARAEKPGPRKAR